MISGDSHTTHSASDGFAGVWRNVVDTLLGPGSTFSLLSLGVALLVAIGWLAWRRGRVPGLKLIRRAILPSWLWRSASTRQDLVFFFVNIAVTGILFGWMLVSMGLLDKFLSARLVDAFGPVETRIASPLARSAIMTVALFLAYDFAYWVDHWLKHRVPFLWEFHRVHHTAETLTPLTVFRVHPVDGAVFHNIMAVALALTHAGVGYIIGGGSELTLSGTNLILLGFVFTTIHLQHSHIPLRFTGLWGKIAFSPAHHQIHHSADPAHYGANLGSCLAVWDWMFGTLLMPEKLKRLRYGAGAETDTMSPHSVAGGLALPLARALATLRPGRATPPPVVATSQA